MVKVCLMIPSISMVNQPIVDQNAAEDIENNFKNIATFEYDIHAYLEKDQVPDKSKLTKLKEMISKTDLSVQVNIIANTAIQYISETQFRNIDIKQLLIKSNLLFGFEKEGIISARDLEYVPILVEYLGDLVEIEIIKKGYTAMFIGNAYNGILSISK